MPPLVIWAFHLSSPSSPRVLRISRHAAVPRCAPRRHVRERLDVLRDVVEVEVAAREAAA